VLGPLVRREVLADADQPEDLAARGLEVQVGVRHVEHRHAEGDDLLPHRLGVVRLQLQEDCLEEAVLVEHALVLVHERDVEVAAQAEVVLLLALPHDLAAQDVPVEPADPVLLRPRDPHRRVVAEACLCHARIRHRPVTEVGGRPRSG
jgi:hypothetical protein